jgi:hypothetical protein
MKNKVLLLITALMLSFGVYSQKFLTLSVGGNIPVGDFVSTSVSNQNSGFAKAGTTFDLTFGKVMYKKLGFMATVRGQLNDLNTDALATAIGVSSSQIAGDKYKSFMIMVGPFLEFKLHEKLALDVKLQGGVISTSFPEYTLVGSSGSADVKANASTSTSVSLGVIFRRKINDNFSVNFTGDCLSATQTFNVVSTTPGGSKTNAQDIPINVINGMVGVSYTF